MTKFYQIALEDEDVEITKRHTLLKDEEIRGLLQRHCDQLVLDIKTAEGEIENGTTN